MELILNRLFDDFESTVGKLYINGEGFCGALEDTRRHEKVAGLTRIPAGRYEIKLRYDSPMAKRYESRYKTKGMIWLQKVVNFNWVYIHIGNDADDSDACILVGWKISLDVQKDRQRIVSSTECYKKLHALVSKALQAGESVFITIIDN